MPDWNQMTERSLAELEDQSDLYRPTNFWGPGLSSLLRDMENEGLESFKSWSTASFWFYPVYGNGYTYALMDKMFELAAEHNEKANLPYLRSSLSGGYVAQRDYDIAVTWWNQDHWPARFGIYGESNIGRPSQGFGVVPGKETVKVGRAYNNYTLMMAALSQHIEAPPQSVLEIGGGFGCLGEVLKQKVPSARYVDVDIPPLLTVASYYLTELYGEDEVKIYDDSVPSSGPIEVLHSAVLPNYRLADIDAEFEVFANSYSFQEMEPDVVDNYIGEVCDKGIRYAVSLNSKLGKPRAEKAGDHGALKPVTSGDIADMFGRRGFRVAGAYDAPYVRAAGQLLVLERS